MAKTAIRRHHTERLKRNRRFYWGWTAQKAKNGFYSYMREKERLSKVARTPKRCSCYMCGNQRRYWGKPIYDLRCDWKSGFELRHKPTFDLNDLNDV